MATDNKNKPSETDAERELREALDVAGASNTAPGPEGSILHADGVAGLDAVAGGAGGGGGVESVSQNLEGGPAPAVQTTDTNARTVTIGCKLPQGLDLGNGIVLRGSNSQGADGLGGYGITENVDAELFDLWVEQHPGNVAIARGLIFKADNAGKARDRAREQSGLVSGFEGLDPNKMPAGLEEEPEAKKKRLKGE